MSDEQRSCVRSRSSRPLGSLAFRLAEGQFPRQPKRWPGIAEDVTLQTHPGIDEMRKNAEGLPADQRKSIEESIQNWVAQLEAMDKDPQMQQVLRNSIEAQRAEERRRQEEAMEY
jgi:hypothetical protein